MYESVVQSNDTNSALFFITVPRRSLPEFIFELQGSQEVLKTPKCYSAKRDHVERV
jgi:hypothetical protein